MPWWVPPGFEDDVRSDVPVNTGDPFFDCPTGSALKTFDLGNPRPGKETDKASVVSSTPFASDFKYRTREPPEGTTRAKRIFRSVNEDERYRAFISAGLSHLSAVEYASVRPQARALFPLADRHTPCIAAGRQGNIVAAIKMRHFPGATQNRVADQVASAMNQFASWIGHRMSTECQKRLSQIDLGELVSKRWGKERAAEAIRLASQGDLAGLHNFFVKLNEAQEHDKFKPRGISASNDPMQVLHLIDAALLERTLFDDPVFESRSIKHGNQETVDARMGRLMKRFAKGKSLSVDFGSWDSTLQNPIRDLLENTIVAEFLKGIDDGGNTLLGSCLADRLKKTLKATAGAATFVAEVFGRQSGDRGTSILNYLTNLCLAFGLAVALGTTDSPRRWYDSLLCNNSKLDFAAEGDDLTLFFSLALCGDEAALVNAFFKHYESLGLKPEPATFGGTATRVPSECLLCPTDRLEFVSRLFFFVDGKCISIPKLSKTLPNVPVTFSKEELMTVGYSAALSGQNNASAHPLLREFYKALQHAYTDGNYLVHDWHSAKLKWWAEDAELSVQAFVAQRVTDHSSDAEVRKRIAKEHPRLTQAVQMRYEDILRGCSAYDRETTLSKLGDVYANIVDLMRT